MDYFSNTGVNATNTDSTHPNLHDYGELTVIYFHTELQQLHDRGRSGVDAGRGAGLRVRRHAGRREPCEGARLRHGPSGRPPDRHLHPLGSVGPSADLERAPSDRGPLPFSERASSPSRSPSCRSPPNSPNGMPITKPEPDHGRDSGPQKESRIRRVTPPEVASRMQSGSCVPSELALRCPSCGHDRVGHGARECVGGTRPCRCTVTLDMLDYVNRRRVERLAAFAADIAPMNVHRRAYRPQSGGDARLFGSARHPYAGKPSSGL